MDLSKMPFSVLQEEVERREEVLALANAEYNKRLTKANKLLEECLEPNHSRIWYYTGNTAWKNEDVIYFEYQRESGYETYTENHIIPRYVLNSDEELTTYFADQKKRANIARAETIRDRGIAKAKEDLKRAQEQYEAELRKYS